MDESRWPLAQVTFRGAPDDGAFEAYFAWNSRILERCERYACVVDAREVKQISAMQRRRQAEWMKRNHDALKEFSVGVAFVIDSPLVRGILTAILWLAPLPQPHFIASTGGEAERWALDRLRLVGLEAPRSGRVIRRG